MDIIYFIKALLKKKWWIAISTIIAIVAAFVFTLGKPRMYASVTQVATGFTTNDQVKLRDENVNVFEADVKFDNVIENINSPVVVGMLSYDLLLHDLTSDKPFVQLHEKDLSSEAYQAVDKQQAVAVLRNKLDSLQVLSSYNPVERNILAFLKLYKYDYESIRKHLNANRVQRTDYLEIVYIAENPEQAAYTVNTIYREFMRYYRSMRSERSVESVESFDELVKQKKAELDLKVEALRAYKASEGLLNVETASGNELDLIKQFEKGLSDENANYNTIVSSLQSVNDRLAVANSGKTVYTNNNSEIIELRKQINDLNNDLTQKGGDDQAMSTKLTSLRSQLQKKLGAATSGTQGATTKDALLQEKSTLEAQQNASRLNMRNLQNQIAKLKGSVGSYANKEANVSSLQAEVEMAQEEYNKLKEKLNAAQDNQTTPDLNFKQILKGQPAFKPESSKRMIIMGMAGISTFLLTSFIVLLLEFLDGSLKSPSVFEKHLDLRLISSVNHAELGKYSILEVLQRTTIPDKQTKQRQNTFRELLRKLRYEIESSGKKSFLITSTEARQGKTTLTQALAYSLSLSNKNVLVIDTNFCNNDITVQMEAAPTLETFSVPPAELSIDKVKAIVTTYAVPGIEVIGCKGGDYTPSEILPKNNLLNYLPFLANYYDFILLEGAPLNDYTDSKELAQYVDGVIAVFSSKLSLTQVDRESAQFFETLGSKFVGAVLNNVQEEFLEL
jgi:polysaccharide biosynthesis transport protein